MLSKIKQTISDLEFHLQFENVIKPKLLAARDPIPKEISEKFDIVCVEIMDCNLSTIDSLRLFWFGILLGEAIDLGIMPVGENRTDEDEGIADYLREKGCNIEDLRAEARRRLAGTQS